ncbi:hypothetical protein PP175_27690 (plasmid) [Aneurinibacillus sp. Ricciae_BoGa-3]|uniref:hypothetical protein n=1 Tax=Aneurinibacillus sp. Ricciae_BoGa-3 TaxID=3022697 RepID=UPI0023423C98|nr:hypothetical protein [Aneurinibacillus sp. Ricciae_BoGa-3]WCK56977.1 hypothetical protein PP175_27690 [Aneurinibacillus sp. Ricciae_BoGa-3]
MSLKIVLFFIIFFVVARLISMIGGKWSRLAKTTVKQDFVIAIVLTIIACLLT